MSIEHLHMGSNMKDIEETKLIKQGISKIIKIKYIQYIYIYIMCVCLGMIENWVPQHLDA